MTTRNELENSKLVFVGNVLFAWLMSILFLSDFGSTHTVIYRERLTSEYNAVFKEIYPGKSI